MTNPKPETQAKRTRSAVTNGKRMFVAGDGHSAWARRHRDIRDMILADIGPIGTLSQAQVGLATRAATLTCQLEAMDGKLSQGEDVDLDIYARVSGLIARLHKILGIKRAARKGSNALMDHFSEPLAKVKA